MINKNIEKELANNVLTSIIDDRKEEAFFNYKKYTNYVRQNIEESNEELNSVVFMCYMHFKNKEYSNE